MFEKIYITHTHTHTHTHTCFPVDPSGNKPTRQCRRRKKCNFSPWIGKIDWKRAWQHTPVFLPGEFPWTEEPDRLQFIGLQRFGQIEATHTHTHTHIYIYMYIYIYTHTHTHKSFYTMVDKSLRKNIKKRPKNWKT